MRFIVIDGLDGSGKDTHASLIKEKYEEKGENVVVRSHPESDNFFGIRGKEALLGGGRKDRIMASVYYALDVIRSIIKYYGEEEYDTLIMVRYLFGTAYLPPKLAKISYEFFKRVVPTSSYMFFLDVPPDELRNRIEDEREETEMFETVDKLAKVRRRILDLIGEGWHRIDTSQSKKEAFESISRILNELDKEKKSL